MSPSPNGGDGNFGDGNDGDDDGGDGDGTKNHHSVHRGSIVRRNAEMSTTSSAQNLNYFPNSYT